MSKIRIALLGLGGVGGYYGGKLARFYSNSKDVEIIFLARGEHLKKIQEKGLRVITDSDDFIAKPTLVTDKTEEVGVVDYLILSTKSYDLHASVMNVKACIGEKTVIVPLLNGGDITEQLRETLPGTEIWSGCSYIVSRRIEPGVIRTTGTFHKLIFGFDGEQKDSLMAMEKLMRNADIDADYAPDIRQSIWQKFFFISVSASLTSYFNIGFNELNETEERRELTREMTCEFLRVAEAEGIDTSENTSEQVINRAGKLPPGSTTSMHSDFISGHANEVETLTGAVVRFAKKHGIDVPMYEKVYDELKKR